jgi:hypothetical protein
MNNEVNGNGVAENVTVMSGSAARTGIWHVLFLALCLRLVLPLWGLLYTHDAKIFSSVDTWSFVAPAQELISHHRFFTHGAPEIIRTPGYPLLLTVGLLAGQLELVTLLLQVLISCFTVYMVYRTAHVIFEREIIAIVAATLYAIEPLSIRYTSTLATETLFSALTIVWLYFLLKYLDRCQLRDLLLSGIVLAASVYVRPVGYFLPVVIAAGLAVWVFVTRDHKMHFMTHVAVFLGVSMLLIGVWQARNQVETGYSGFSGISSINMYYYLASSVLAVQQQVPFFEMQRRLGYRDKMQGRLGYLDDHIYFERHPEQKTWALAERLNYMSREGEHILLRHPLTYLWIHIEGIVRSMFDPSATGLLKFFRLIPDEDGIFGKLVDRGIVNTMMELRLKNPLVFWANALLLLLQLLYLSFASLVLFSRWLIREPKCIAAILVVAYYLVITGGPAANSRFRHPAMPIICVLAGYGMYQVWRRLQAWFKWRVSMGDDGPVVESEAASA